MALTLLIVPVTRLDPLALPTPAPTLPPGATKRSTQTPFPSPTTLPTPVPSLTPTVTSTPAPAPATPTATATVVPTLPSTATSARYAIIGGTDRRRAYLRREPGHSAVAAGVPDGVLVEEIGGSVDANGLPWAEVILPDGRVGRVAQPFLVPYRVYRAH